MNFNQRTEVIAQNISYYDRLDELVGLSQLKFHNNFIDRHTDNFANRLVEINHRLSNDNLNVAIAAVFKKLNYDFRRVEYGNRNIEYKHIVDPNSGAGRLNVYVRASSKANDVYLDDGDKYTVRRAAISSSRDQNKAFYSIDVMGGESDVNKFLEIFHDDFVGALNKATKKSVVKWAYLSGDGSRKFHQFEIQKDWQMDKSFYPWIDRDLNDYYDAYLNSKAQILLLHGVPGTGKTSFIRDMICEMGMNAIISYDLALLSSDATFIDHLADPRFDTIIIEDADDLLTSGDRSAHNKLIAKILNVSDGIIKLPEKKMIFSTNLRSVKDIDPAIIRPGRCFDCMEFKELTVEEAEVVAEKIGVADKFDGKEKSYPLSKIFLLANNESNGDPIHDQLGSVAKKNKIGF